MKHKAINHWQGKPDPTQADYVAAAQLLTDADALLIGGGAGMGVDSGLPAFRGDQGFWSAYPAYPVSMRRYLFSASNEEPAW